MAIPVLVGVSELTRREVDLEHVLEPVDWLENAARAAAEDAGAGEKLLAELDTVALVDAILWTPENGPRLLAERLGMTPERELQGFAGGESPIALLNDAAERILDGRSRGSLVAGVNVFKTIKAGYKRGEKFEHWQRGGGESPEPFGEHRDGSTELEMAYGLRMPAGVYPIFENALRRAHGLSLEAHRRAMGELFHPFSKIAASNPNAWFPTERSAEELATVSAHNRLVGFPYTKYMNAVMETDQAAAMIIVSDERARALGIPEERFVYWYGGAKAIEEPWFPSERPDFADCPSMRLAHETTLSRAGVSIDEIGVFDLYSCFPSAVFMACDMLGLDPTDPRDFTVTGGLPYYGGPGNNYCTHSVAGMVQRLRKGREKLGLVTGNGMYLSKHASVVLGSEPRTDAFSRERGAPTPPEKIEPVEVVDGVEGEGVVETYTALHGRDGLPNRGIVIGRYEDGRRFLANTTLVGEPLAALLGEEWIGRRGRVRAVDGKNTFDFE